MSDLPPLPLPEGVTSRYVECALVGLNFHFLEAGYDSEKPKDLILLLHGYPELAFSWRKVIPALAAEGYHVVAPDQRGYGRTTGWPNSKWGETDLSCWNSTTLVRDLVVFVNALGHKTVHTVVGHDFGAVSASMCALMRPDMFKSLVLMSHPYKSIPGVPFDTAHGKGKEDAPVSNIHADLGALSKPRKHYRVYNSTEQAASDWDRPPQGLQAYLRGYIHVKSANWARNKPHPLKGWTAEQAALLPFYYIMPYQSNMPEVVVDLMDGEDASLTTSWLSDDALAVYVQEWGRTGFQGALNWYRAAGDPGFRSDLALFVGKSTDIPTTFISGAQDWGNYQEPGALENMDKTCTQFHGVSLIEGAGHWPQQEQPEKVVEELLKFARKQFQPLPVT
jgi:pimeloyl-ACP methyl ester carboxylesterase